MSSPHPKIFPAPPPIYLVDDFLDKALASDILSYFLDQETQFFPSTIQDKDDPLAFRHVDAIRKSQNCKLPKPRKNALWETVQTVLPDVQQSIGVKLPESYSLEGYGVAHGDGEFYKAHSDVTSDNPKMKRRMISFICYLHTDPKSYTGGELRLYSPDQTAHRDVTPVHNRAVFFPSFFLHEVMETHVPSKAFDHSRFAYVGWVRRDEESYFLS